MYKSSPPFVRRLKGRPRSRRPTSLQWDGGRVDLGIEGLGVGTFDNSNGNWTTFRYLKVGGGEGVSS